MIKATIIGNIGISAIEKKTKDGDSYFIFTLAANNKKEAPPLWVTVFTRQHKLAPYLVKGAQVYVDGNLDVYIYKNKEGQQAVGMTINNPTIRLVGSKKDDASTFPIDHSNDNQLDDTPF